MAKSYYVGMEIEAPCGRCKGETRHRIHTITDGVPEKLICMGCNSVHKFRQEKPVRVESASRAPRSASPTVARTAVSPNHFQELLTSEQGGSRAQPYSPAVKWEEGLWIDHPNFGLGRVQKKSGRKVDVLFREGLKTLISA